MLSVLIPIYNQNVNKLVRELWEQLKKSKITFEIICFDDGSTVKYLETNRSIESLLFVSYVELRSNRGRSKIRNQLAQNARYNKLLFLDSDSHIKSKKFIKNYIPHIEKEDIICGGRIYNKRAPKDNKKRLHYDYGTKRESKPAAKRNKAPIRFFHTNNFIIDRALILRYPFNESVSQYGYEDLALASSLIKKGYDIKHIDNPILHRGLEKSDVFLQKIEESIDNLIMFYRIRSIDRTPLIRTFELLSKLNGTEVFAKYYEKREKKIIENLHSDSPSLRNLDYYKLYHFIKRIDSV